MYVFISYIRELFMTMKIYLMDVWEFFYLIYLLMYAIIFKCTGFFLAM